MEINSVEINEECIRLANVQIREGILDEMIVKLEKKIKIEELVGEIKGRILSILGLKTGNQAKITEQQLLDLYKKWLEMFKIYVKDDVFLFFSEDVRKILKFNWVLYIFLLQHLGAIYAQHYLYYSQSLIQRIEEEIG